MQILNTVAATTVRKQRSTELKHSNTISWFLHMLAELLVLVKSERVVS